MIQIQVDAGIVYARVLIDGTAIIGQANTLPQALKNLMEKLANEHTDLVSIKQRIADNRLFGCPSSVINDLNRLIKYLDGCIQELEVLA
jgi:hypothetical protein